MTIFSDGMLMGTLRPPLRFIYSVARPESTGVLLPSAADGIEAGDICVISIARNTSLSVPSGWTQVVSGSLGTFVMRSICKVLVPADLGATLATGSSSFGGIFVYRPKSTPTLTVGALGTSGSNSNPAAINGSLSGVTNPVIVIGSARSEPGPPAWSDVTPEFQSEVSWGNSVGGVRVGASFYNKDPLNQTIDINDNGNQNQMTLGKVEVIL